MSWSYSGNPTFSVKDQVRFLIGDTNSNDQILQDGEIEWVLSLYNNSPNNAAIRCCETIISKFARMVDQSVGQVKVSWSQRMKSYEQTLQMLRNRLSIEDSGFYAGGISRTDKLANNENTDNVRPDFRKHMMENEMIAPWTTSNQFGWWEWYGD